MLIFTVCIRTSGMAENICMGEGVGSRWRVSGMVNGDGCHLKMLLGAHPDKMKTVNLWNY